MGVSWNAGSYHLVYKGDDGEMFVIYYYHGMANYDTACVWRVPI